MSKRPSLKQINDSIFLLSPNNAAISSDTERETGRGNCSSTQLDSGREKETRHGLLQQTFAPYLTENSGLGGKMEKAERVEGEISAAESVFRFIKRARCCCSCCCRCPCCRPPTSVGCCARRRRQPGPNGQSRLARVGPTKES